MLDYSKYEKDLKQLGITNTDEQRLIMQALYNYAMVACDIYLKRNMTNDEESNNPLQRFS
jgi:hypothetical protein